MYAEHLELQADATLQETLQNMETEAIMLMLHRVDQQIEQCRAMPTWHVFGVFVMHTTGARSKVEERLQASRQLLRELVPRVYAVHAGAFYTDVLRKTAAVEMPFKPVGSADGGGGVEEYVQTVQTFRAAMDSKEAYQFRYQHCQSLSSLIEDEDIEHSVESNQLSLHTGAAFHHLEDALSAFDDAMPENAKLCAIELRALTKSFEEPMDATARLLESQLVQSSKTDADAAIDRLYAAEAAMREVQRRGEVVLFQQEVTGCDVYDIAAGMCVCVCVCLYMLLYASVPLCLSLTLPLSPPSLPPP